MQNIKPKQHNHELSYQCQQLLNRTIPIKSTTQNIYTNTIKISKLSTFHNVVQNLIEETFHQNQLHYWALSIEILTSFISYFQALRCVGIVFPLFQSNVTIHYQTDEVTSQAFEICFWIHHYL